MFCTHKLFVTDGQREREKERTRDKKSSRMVSDIHMFILVRANCSLQTDRERGGGGTTKKNNVIKNKNIQASF